ncbi:MAG: glycosyltransferase [Desulfosarcinaceae bacterium]
MRAARGAPVLGLVLKGYPRISETFISNEILLLERRGIRIHIFSMRHPRETFSHASVRQIQAEVDYLPDTILGHLPRLLAHNGRLALRQPRRYGHALRIALRRFRRTRKSATLKHLLQAGYLTDRLLPGSGVVHLHAHFAHSPTSVAMFTSFLSGKPFSFFGHAKDIYTADPRQLAEKIGLARFVATCTRYNRDYLRSIKGNYGTPIHCVYHGIDTRLFEADPQLDAPRPPFEILTMARLTAKKGLPTVLRALRRLKAAGLPFRHTLIGDGDDREMLLEMIRNLDLGDVCRWLGTQPHEGVIERFKRSHAFALGCEVAVNGDRDGIPNVLVESMAMGVPVVATTVSAIGELVVDGEHGLLVPSHDPGALARGLVRILTDLALRRRVIPAARQRVLGQFDNQILIEKLAGHYLDHIPELRPA